MKQQETSNTLQAVLNVLLLLLYANGCRGVDDVGGDVDVRGDGDSDGDGDVDGDGDGDGDVDGDGGDGDGGADQIELEFFLQSSLEVAIYSDDPTQSFLLADLYLHRSEGGGISGLEVEELTLIVGVEERTATEYYRSQPEGLIVGIPASATEGDLCAAGPALLRGFSGVDDVTLRLAGDSDEGRWSAAGPVDGMEIIKTCHGGESRFAWADVVNRLDPVLAGTELSLHVAVTPGDTHSVVSFDSTIIHGEGVEEIYDIGSTTGWYELSHEFEQLVLIFQSGPDGIMGDPLCPLDLDTFLTTPLFAIYEGSVDGRTFWGTAPVGQCQVL